ncbi:MAG: N-acetylglucosamine-6-phosphate deacetylase [Anaerolineales bacterium]
MADRAIIGGRAFTPEPIDGRAIVLIAGDRIKAVGPENETPLPTNCDTIQASGCLILPGLIDLHTHGLLGSDAMGDGLAQAIADYPSRGVTGFLATTLARPADDILPALEKMDRILSAPPPGSQCLGIHLEGPYLAADQAGMANPSHTKDFEWSEFERFQAASGQRIRCLTLAPERVTDRSDFDRLTASGVLISLGHTGASFQQTQDAISAGASRATHLFNAMGGIHQRSPGAAIAALLDDRVVAELIADGVHLAPALLELAVRLKGAARIVAVSDSSPQAGLPDGEYLWGDSEVQVRDHRCQLADGTLAGSWYGLDQSIRTLVLDCGLPIPTAAAMATRTPSDSLRLSDRGRLSPGSRADLCLLDSDLVPIHTIVAGKTVWRADQT